MTLDMIFHNLMPFIILLTVHDVTKIGEKRGLVLRCHDNVLRTARHVGFYAGQGRFRDTSGLTESNQCNDYAISDYCCSIELNVSPDLILDIYT